MSQKIEKIDAEIVKAEAKLAEIQTLLRDLRSKKTEAENLEIIAIVRSVNIPRTELANVLAAFKQGKAFPVIGSAGDKPASDPDPDDDTDPDDKD